MPWARKATPDARIEPTSNRVDPRIWREATVCTGVRSDVAPVFAFLVTIVREAAARQLAGSRRGGPGMDGATHRSGYPGMRVSATPDPARPRTRGARSVA